MESFIAMPLASKLGLGLTAGSSLLQFGQQRAAASAAEAEGKFAAKQEKLAATQRETDRKERLATAMASQTASAGARGVLAFEGSPLTILQEDIRKEEVATERDIFGSKLAAAQARLQGSNRAKALKSGATIGLLKDTSDLVKTLPTG